MRVSVQKAAELILLGNVVAIPTETVYGLGASLYNAQAIEMIFTLKGRPANNPLIIHVSSANEVESYITNLPPNFYDLAQSFWPGPMTLVLECDISKVDTRARAGLPTAAFRIPDHPETQKLLKMTGPLVMPSANVSGRPSATSPEHVEHDFGVDFPVLDGDKCDRGVESTILIFNEDKWKVIRLGAIPAEAFKDILGYIPIFENASLTARPLCPGQLYRHYAPKAKLILARKFNTNMKGTVIGFSDRTYPENLRVIPLGSTENAKEAGEHLYAALRQLDEEGLESVFVDIDIPEKGLWTTILERLKKAAQSSTL